MFHAIKKASLSATRRPGQNKTKLGTGPTHLIPPFSPIYIVTETDHTHSVVGENSFYLPSAHHRAQADSFSCISIPFHRLHTTQEPRLTSAQTSFPGVSLAEGQGQKNKRGGKSPLSSFVLEPQRRKVLVIEIQTSRQPLRWKRPPPGYARKLTQQSHQLH